MRDGITDCFDFKDLRDNFFDKVIRLMRAKEIPSDVEVCKGDSPYGEELPYPYCVNTRWEMEKGQRWSMDSAISKAWDDWFVRQHKEKAGLGYSEDIYSGPERVEEFDNSFMFVKCEDIKKLKQVL